MHHEHAKCVQNVCVTFMCVEAYTPGAACDLHAVRAEMVPGRNITTALAGAC